MYRRGQVLKETYSIEEPLSGSKTAFKATHIGLTTNVVVELFSDQTGVEKLEYEERQNRKKEFMRRRERLKQLASVSHPTLARVVDVFESEERHFLVREWVEGYTLRKLVEESLKPLSQETAMGFCHQLLSLMDSLRLCEPPLVMGTLCPDYLVVGPNGSLKVIDYGVAHHAPGKTEFEPFSCPELLSGGELDLRADFYSLAAVLYFAVTGSELPPIWDRITCKETIPAPSELQVHVDGRFWSALETLLSLAVNDRPETVDGVRTLFEKGEFENTPDASPATWYPEQSDLLLADSYPFAPFSKPDWILKMVQAATVGRARGLAVVQGREDCSLDFLLAKPDVPAPQDVLNALTTDEPITNPVVAELACGLRIIGEFRNFRVVLDDWKHSWTLKCRGGKISSWAGQSFGRSGMYVEVQYEGRPSDRAAQAADELIRLVRKTRLCTVPITVGKKPLEPGRGVDISELPKEVVELYLASASLPAAGGFKLTELPDEESGNRRAFTAFTPRTGKIPASHVDVRCYVSPGDSTLGRITKLGYHFVRRPSRILWYRHGVLCGESFLEKKLPLQLDIHLNGDHLEADKAGLKLELPNWIQVARLRPVLELSRILPITRLKLDEFWEETPTDGSPASTALVGLLGAPLMFLFFGNLVGPGLVFLKKTALAGLLKTSAAAGGLLGYNVEDHLDAVRKACFKALDAFAKEEIG